LKAPKSKRDRTSGEIRTQDSWKSGKHFFL